jgi:hypothetical protein
MLYILAYILEVMILCVFHARTDGAVAEKYIYSSKFYLRGI